MISLQMAQRLRCWQMRLALAAVRLADRLGASPGAAQPVLVVSPPKAGTHLLSKALRLLPGVGDSHIHIERPLLNHMAPPSQRVEEWPIRFPRDTHVLQHLLSRIGPGRFCTTHMGYTDELMAMITQLDFKVLLIVRDPRDMAVSLVNYLKRQRYHPLHDYFQDLPFEQALTHTIVGLDRSVAGRALPDLHSRFSTYDAWCDQPRVYTLKFEELIGERGGGNDADQRRVLKAIADHLGLPLTERSCRRIATKLFGGTATFHKGTTGQWRERFNDHHLALAREHLTDLLIQFRYETTTAW